MFMADVYGKPIDGIEAHELFDEVLLYIPDREMALSLNRSASAIWRLCDGHTSAAEIAVRILATLGMEDPGTLEQLQRDVVAALYEFSRQGIIELVSIREASAP